MKAFFLFDTMRLYECNIFSLRKLEIHGKTIFKNKYENPYFVKEWHKRADINTVLKLQQKARSQRSGVRLSQRSIRTIISVFYLYTTKNADSSNVKLILENALSLQNEGNRQILTDTCNP